LDGEESVGVDLFSDSFEENREIMMVIKLLDINLPVDFVLWTVFNGYWKISSIVEKSEFTDRNLSTVDSSSLWFQWNWLCLWNIQAETLST
jgi:hypothetical protein